jgi:hypothetical protein
VVLYTAGYMLPGTPECKPPFGLPAGIQGAVVAPVSDCWATAAASTLRSESIPGVRDVTYWVGAVGDPQLLPSRVLGSFWQFRRRAYAVA